MTRRNPLVAGILLILALIPAFSLEKPSIFLGTSGGVSLGEAHEFVYTNNKVLSELIWDMKPLTTLGIDMNLQWAQRFQITSSLMLGLPFYTGSMTDSDYLNLLSDGTTYKTTFSSHDAHLNHSINLNFNTGWRFELHQNGPGTDQKIMIIPSVGFRYLSYKWSGQNGYLQHTIASVGVYPAWDPDQPKVKAYGTAIDYQQQYWIPTLGIAVDVPVGTRDSLNFELQGSPIVFCQGTDRHYIPTSGWDYTNSTQYTEYKDILSGGYLVEPTVSFKHIITDKILFTAGVGCTIIRGLRGETYKDASGIVTKFSKANGGGASFQTINVKLGITTRLR